MSRACVLSHQYSCAVVLLCTRPPSCVSRFTVLTTADTLGVSPPVTKDNCLTGPHHRHYMRPRPICLECPGTASIPRRQVMVATQPPPRDVSFIADIDDVIAPPPLMSCTLLRGHNFLSLYIFILMPVSVWCILSHLISGELISGPWNFQQQSRLSEFPHDANRAPMANRT